MARGEPRSALVPVRLTSTEKAIVMQAARKAGQSVSKFAGLLILSALFARKAEEKAKR
jgi:hypothetical protein